MAQGILPFKYETEKNTTGMTALADLPVYLDLAQVMGLNKSIEKHYFLLGGGFGKVLPHCKFNEIMSENYLNRR